MCMCVAICNCGVRGDQVYTECMGIDKDEANAERESKANTAPLNAMVFERQWNKALIYLAWGNTQKVPALQRSRF